MSGYGFASAIRKVQEALGSEKPNALGADTAPGPLLGAGFTEGDIVALLEAGPGEQRTLFALADEVRRGFMGDAVHLRGIIEFSNYCVRNCVYCGLRRDNRRLVRYRMSVDEIVQVSARAAAAGYRTIVLQSGDDLHYRAEDIARMVEGIKQAVDVAVTLSVGERSRQEYAIMRRAGADRFLLKHETADPGLYSRLHPGMTLEGRLECLAHLRGLGFQVGSGNIVGLPGQTARTLAKDIMLLRSLDVEMAGIGPFIPHPDTPLASRPPGDLSMSLRTLAVARLVLPLAHLPATTALATLHPDGRRMGLECGANVVMPNVTPLEFRRLYEIYPGSIALAAPDDGGLAQIRALLSGLGRQVSHTCGHSPKPAWAAGHSAASVGRRGQSAETALGGGRGGGDSGCK
ncbi:MAG: [FeFe] hydrogenase H-cluster radical SAM maturase HydE [Bacillota bacterium]|nr:[FeFe] hydrogenase H-cluster radical SAM maturase HydE [Bacillota bacterium]